MLLKSNPLCSFFKSVVKGCWLALIFQHRLCLHQPEMNWFFSFSKVYFTLHKKDPTLCQILTVAIALPIHFHPCLACAALTGVDGVCSLQWSQNTIWAPLQIAQISIYVFSTCYLNINLENVIPLPMSWSVYLALTEPPHWVPVSPTETVRKAVEMEFLSRKNDLEQPPQEITDCYHGYDFVWFVTMKSMSW